MCDPAPLVTPDAHLAALIVAARALLPPGTGVGAADPQADHPPYPGEDMPGAVDLRLREFRAGRSAARMALAEIGLPPGPIPRRADRAPVFPLGIAASITHTRHAALAAARRGLRGLGLDLEPAGALPDGIWDMVLTPPERRIVGTDGLAARIVFSAKEAAYKAQYAISEHMFGFDAMAITLDGDAFSATFLRDVPGFPAGSVLQGRIARVSGNVLTAVAF